METNKPVRVAFYMRVSTSEQLEGFSLEMQEKALKEHVVRNGYKGWQTKPEWIFHEQGSGADVNRNQLERLMEMAKKKEFDLVLVWKIDRISRSLTDLLGIFETLNKYGVGFASLKEDIDFTGAIGRLIFQIFGALAEFERETIKMRTEEGKKMSAHAGNYIGGSIPYAYRKVPNKAGKGSKLALIPKEAKIAKQIFDWFLYSNWTLAQIAKELNKMGISKGESAIKTSRHKKWLDNCIRGVLQNDVYRGQYISNRYICVNKKPKRYVERPQKEWITSKVEGVVSDLMFLQVQERLKNGSKGLRGGGKEVYMLAGKLVDIITSKGFVGYKAGKGTKNYRRKKLIDKKTGEVHRTISIGAKELENYVWSFVEKAIHQPAIFLKIHKQNSENFKKQQALQSKYQIYEKALSEANGIIEAVDLDLYKGKIDESRRDELKTQYMQKREENFNEMKEIEGELKGLSQYDSACRDLDAFSMNMKEGTRKLTYEQKKAIVSMLVERVEIHDKEDTRTAKVFFRFDQRAISNAIPSGRTDLAHTESQIFSPKRQILFNGGQGGIRTPEGRSQQIYSLSSLTA
jgi:site-specific DNA recombinase